MLIEHKPVHTLDASARQRLAANAQMLLKSPQAQQGVVMFEGNYFSVAELRSLLPNSRSQILTEG